MAAPQSPVDIANLALIKLNANIISSFTQQNSKAAPIANLTYDQNRRSLLRMYRWNFAQKRDFAQLTTSVPNFDYLYEYQLPDDFIRILRVGSKSGSINSGVPGSIGTGWSYRRYDIQGQMLLIDPVVPYACDGNSPWVNITGISQANPAVVVAPGHTFTNGDEIQIINVGGMTELNNEYFLVANPTVNTFQLQNLSGVPLNTTGYTAYTSGGQVAEGDPTSPPTQDSTTPPSQVPILYVCDYTDVSTMDASFIDALVAKLAVEMCVPLLGKTDRLKELMGEFDLKIKQAQGINFQEKPQEIIEHDPIAESRVTAGGIFYPNGGSGYDRW